MVDHPKVSFCLTQPSGEDGMEWPPEKTACLDAPEIFHARRARGPVRPGLVGSPGWTGGGGTENPLKVVAVSVSSHRSGRSSPRCRSRFLLKNIFSNGRKISQRFSSVVQRSRSSFNAQTPWFGSPAKENEATVNGEEIQ